MVKTAKRQGGPRSFSLLSYLFAVIILSWPFQFAYFLLGKSYRPILLVSMIMVAVATYIYGKWWARDEFANAGWHWGRPKQYLYVFLLAMFLWLFPSFIERLMDWYSPMDSSIVSILSSFTISFTITIIPAFSEEFAWRGYLLPRLIERYSYRKALLVHGLITWIWHLPFVIALGFETGDNPWISVPLVLMVSFIPTIMHAVVFAYIWARSGSLVVSTMYHISFDEIRDTLEINVGLGALGQNWQMLVLTVLGIILLRKVQWKNYFPAYPSVQ